MLLNLENFSSSYLYVISPTDHDDKSEIECAFEKFNKVQKRQHNKIQEA